MRLLAWTAIATFLIDQISKYLVVEYLNLKEIGELAVFPPFLNFHMAWNYGVNFGLFANDAGTMRWALITLALVIVGFVIHWVKKNPTGPLGMFSAGILVGGALGNVIDRVIYGAVADFLNMSCCGFHNPYAFNVADIAIFAGAIGLAIFADAPKEA